MEKEQISKLLAIGANGVTKIVVHKPDAFVTRSKTEQVDKVTQELKSRANGVVTKAPSKCQGCGE